MDETFDVGVDTGTPVSLAYDVPFAFTGQIDRLVVDLGELKLAGADQQTLEERRRSARTAE
jgi:arylsulfatase